MIPARFDHQEDIAGHIKSFWFKPERPLRYIAGQFTQLQLPLSNPDARGDKHWFTLSSSPSEPLVGITTKFTPEAGSSFKQALLDLQPGDPVLLAEPMGDFVLPKDPTIPLLFVAGGIGVTPIRSIIRWLHDTNEQRSVHLLYSVRKTHELAFRDLFEMYDMTLTPIVTEPDPSWQGQSMPLTSDQIMQLAGPHHLVYLSGPEPMVETFVDELRGQGFPHHRLITDYFSGYPGL